MIFGSSILPTVQKSKKMENTNWGNVALLLKSVFRSKDPRRTMHKLSHMVRECVRKDVFFAIGVQDKGFNHPMYHAFRRRVHFFRDQNLMGEFDYFFGDAKEGKIR